MEPDEDPAASSMPPHGDTTAASLEPDDGIAPLKVLGALDAGANLMDEPPLMEKNVVVGKDDSVEEVAEVNDFARDALLSIADAAGLEGAAKKLLGGVEMMVDEAAPFLPGAKLAIKVIKEMYQVISRLPGLVFTGARAGAVSVGFSLFGLYCCV